MIYLDYSASTPVDKEVLDVFYDTTNKYYANPNSSHKLGREAKELIDNATKHMAQILKVEPEEIIYTSGDTESNNLVIKGICERYKNRGKHLLLSALEHNSLIVPATLMQNMGFEVELIPIGKDGLVDIEQLKKMIREDTILVSIITIDSELGIKQPIEKIGHFLKDYPNIIFHTDASQAIGKIAVDFTDVDLVTIAPHKFYGLNGTGMLIKKKAISLTPQIDGGKSTTIYRSGTPVVANILSLDKALTIAIDKQSERTKYVQKLYNQIIEALEHYPYLHINNTSNSIPYIVNFSVKQVKSMDIVQFLEDHDIYVSSKTSCCPIGTPSKLVYALTKDKSLATSSIRISLSHLTTEQEILCFLHIFEQYYKELFHGKI